MSVTRNIRKKFTDLFKISAYTSLVLSPFSFQTRGRNTKTAVSRSAVTITNNNL